MQSELCEIYSGTPEVMVTDNRGSAVRGCCYHRHPQAPTHTDVRITRHRYEARGNLALSIDPRLHEAGKRMKAVKANATLRTSLVGEVLMSESVDAGTDIQLKRIDGRALFGCQGSGNTRRHHYEAASTAGRLATVTDQAAAAEPYITERFIWSDDSPTVRGRNLAGRVVRLYDTAGLDQTGKVGLSGRVESATRMLLEDGRTAHWQGTDEAAWVAVLAPMAYTSTWRGDALGAHLNLTDAQGHQQHHAYDVTGELANTWLALRGSPERAILSSVAASASGDKVLEAHGNGVISRYRYDERTQHLAGIRVERPAGHALGAKVLQDLRYERDPVGNVLAVHHDAEATRFWCNQKLVPESRYSYDSLYQLVCASGQERVGVARQPARRPCGSAPCKANDATLSNYTRSYQYDRAGNLACITHRSPVPHDSYRIHMTVSDRSNRAVLSTQADDPATVDALFDHAGNQRQLHPGQPLHWTSRQTLERIVLATHESGAVDRESYRYDARRQRIEKLGVQLKRSTVSTQRVLYLPALDLRVRRHGERLEEDLHVITVGEAGRAQARVLHWASGLPSGVRNDSVRFSHGDLIGSVGLELDGDGQVISREDYYPFGGTAIASAPNQVEASYKTVRYGGKERDATGLYYYGHRYYQPWLARWLSADPAGARDGLNLYRMVRNNPVTLGDAMGLEGEEDVYRQYAAMKRAASLLGELHDSAHDFLQSKRGTIAASAASTALKGVIVSAGSWAGSVLGSAVPVVGTYAFGLIAAEGLEAMVPDYRPLPDLKVAQSIKAEAETGAFRRRMRWVANKTRLGTAAEEIAGNVFSQTTAHTLMGSAATAVPLIPVFQIAQFSVRLLKAINTSKEALAAALEEEVGNVEVIVEGLNQSMQKVFAERGTSQAFYQLPWSVRKTEALGVRVNRASLISPNVVTFEKYNRHYDAATQQIEKIRNLVLRRRHGALSSHRPLSHFTRTRAQ